MIVHSERGARRHAIVAFAAAAPAMLGVLAVGDDAAIGRRGKAGGWGCAVAFAAALSGGATVVFALVLVLVLVLVLLAPHGLAVVAQATQRAGAILGAAVAGLVVGANLIARLVSGSGGIGHIGALPTLVLLGAIAAALVAARSADKR